MEPASKRPKPLSTPGGWLSTRLVALGVWLLERLSPRRRAALARAVGRTAYALGIRRKVTLDNLAHAFPEKTDAERRAIARGAYENMALVAVEAVTSHLVKDEELASLVRPVNAEALQRLWDERQPVLLVSAHFGSWELFSEVMARRGVPLAAVVRPLKGAFNDRVVQARLRAGVELIPARGAVRGLLKAMKRGATAVQLIDQSVPADVGVFVPFFGRPACTAPALSAAALRTGVPVFVLVAARVDDHLEMFAHGPVPIEDTGDFRADVQAHTARVTAILEQEIRKRPEQWLWLHRRWKVQPPPETQMATRSPTPNEPAG